MMTLVSRRTLPGIRLDLFAAFLDGLGHRVQVGGVNSTDKMHEVTARSSSRPGEAADKIQDLPLAGMVQAFHLLDNLVFDGLGHSETNLGNGILDVKVRHPPFFLFATRPSCNQPSERFQIDLRKWYSAISRWKPIAGLLVDSRKSFKNLTASVGRGGYMTSGDQKIAKIQTHFQALTTAATSLNAASDELAKVASVLDEALKRLNIGLVVWVTVSRWVDDQGRQGTDQIGYCKVDGKWGIALSRSWDDDLMKEEVGLWLFNGAPRELRLRGVDKLPEVIEALSKEACETTKKVQEKTKEVRELANVIEKIANEPRRAERSKKGASFGTSGITEVQLKGILAGVREHQKFLGELLEQASHWELGTDDLWIYFPADKRPFAEMLEGRESLSKVNGVVNQVLGYPGRVVVKVEPQTVTNSAASTGRGGK